MRKEISKMEEILFRGLSKSEEKLLIDFIEEHHSVDSGDENVHNGSPSKKTKKKDGFKS